MLNSFFRVLIKHYSAFLILVCFIVIHFIYFYFSGWLFSLNQNYEHLAFIISTLSAAATTFAAVTAAILIQNWKLQHNLSLASKIATEIWDLHTKLTADIYKLIYSSAIQLNKDDYELIYASLIQTAVPLRSKSEQFKILLETQFDSKSWESLQTYLEFLEYFYPWSPIEFQEYRTNHRELTAEFRYINAQLLRVLEKYITIE